MQNEDLGQGETSPGFFVCDVSTRTLCPECCFFAPAGWGQGVRTYIAESSVDQFSLPLSVFLFLSFFFKKKTKIDVCVKRKRNTFLGQRSRRRKKPDSKSPRRPSVEPGCKPMGLAQLWAEGISDLQVEVPKVVKAFLGTG